MVKTKPILYICPHCTKGRFTADDGWDGAVKHIAEKHPNGQRRTVNMRDPDRFDLPLFGPYEGLLDEPRFG